MRIRGGDFSSFPRQEIGRGGQSRKADRTRYTEGQVLSQGREEGKSEIESREGNAQEQSNQYEQSLSDVHHPYYAKLNRLIEEKIGDRAGDYTLNIADNRIPAVSATELANIIIALDGEPEWIKVCLDRRIEKQYIIHEHLKLDDGSTVELVYKDRHTDVPKDSCHIERRVEGGAGDGRVEVGRRGRTGRNQHFVAYLQRPCFKEKNVRCEISFYWYIVAVIVTFMFCAALHRLASRRR